MNPLVAVLLASWYVAILPAWNPQICSLVTLKAAPRAAPIHPAITPPRDVHT